MTTALLFEGPAPASTHLVFGGEAVASATQISIAGAFPAPTLLVKMYPAVELGITGTFPAPSLAVSLVANVKLSVTGTFPALQAVAEVVYIITTSRPTVAQVLDTVQVATPVEWGVSQPQQHALRNNTGAQAAFTEGQRVNVGSSTGFDNGLRTPTVVRTGFDNAAAVQSTTAARMQEGDRQWLKFFAQFQEADRLAAARLAGVMQDGIRNYTAPLRGPFHEARKRAAVKYTGRAKPAVPTQRTWWAEFQEAIVPPAGVSPVPVIPVVPPAYWGAELLFQCPPLAFPELVFGAFPCYIDVPTGTVVVPVKRVYIVINSASLRRVDGNIQIPLLNLSMGLDVDSWTWSASAALPGRALDAVAPNSNGDPVEVEALINGVAYRFLVETISRDRTFNQSALRIGMRGKTALLDAPYAPTMNFSNTDARTMVQLAEDVLTINGVSMGWGVNWAQDSWSVPAGVFSHQGSYISALNALAGAAGAYIQPHRTLQELSVLARYPTAPWEWASATPDFELPSAVTVQEGIEWVNRPQYNRVFVSGVSQGVLGQVTRTGTAGDLVAQMVTDALITDALAVRQRGLPILADTGRIANVSLKLPVLPETGIIPPGKMIRYVDGGVSRIGISRSVSVSVGASAVDLRQTIAVETHE